MGRKLEAVEVFTPSDFPAHTYVARDDAALESRLTEALATPGEIISVSGPSKSGKTVLIEKVVGADNLITVTGASIKSGDELWERTLDWMETPYEVSVEATDELHVGGEGNIEGQLGIPLIAGAKASGSLSAETVSGKGTEALTKRTGLFQVIKEIGESDFVLFIDDFHYMERSVQEDVARQIKEAASKGVKICTASVPHRSDDVVRSNPELRGRVRAIDQSYWDAGDLFSIGDAGFDVLEAEVDQGIVKSLASEASGSPQLMQSLCLQLCFTKGIRQQVEGGELVEITEEDLEDVLYETSTRTDFSSLVRNMYSGPKSRGTERKVHQFIDGTSGDVYRATLLAIAHDPPRLSFDYDMILGRVSSVCVGEEPRPQSIQQACYQLSEIAAAMYPAEGVIAWDGADDLLEIVDPYFLFFLRHSGHLERLGGVGLGEDDN